MITECHYCPTEIDTLKDDVLFTNSAYGTNHPTCECCYESHIGKQMIEDLPVNTKILSDEFTKFLLSLQIKTITICLN